MAALTADALWIQDTWQLRRLPLHTLGDIEVRPSGTTLTLTVAQQPPADRLRLAFASPAEARQWSRELQARSRQQAPEAPRVDRLVPEGVALVRRPPDVPYVGLGRVGFTGRTPRAADRGLQLRAGMRGADAVIAVRRQRCPEIGWGARHVSGVAVRVADADAGRRLRLRWYAEEVGALVNRMLLLLALQAALLVLAAVFCAGVSSLAEPTGETPSQALATAGLGLALLYAWPLGLLALLRFLRWPQLLRGAAVAVLAATSGRGLAVLLAHLWAILTTGAGPAESQARVLADPVDWAFIVAGVVLSVRAWRLGGEARDMLPEEDQDLTAARKAWARGLLALTGVYALALLGFVAVVRYQASAYLLRPGVDARREHQALLALNEGAALANKGDLATAEQSFQRSLRLWEELTRGRPAPAAYRANLAMTLNNLGWVRQRQGRGAEAEQYYARAVALADELAGDPELDDAFKQTMAGARAELADLRGGELSKLLDEKNRAAARKYEEAQVQADRGAAEAEGLFRGAIALWEEVLPQATNDDYRRAAVARLATAYLQLGELLVQLGQRPQAEAALRKGISYGEQAVALEPDRPLPRHNLEVARRMLDELSEEALQEEITRLCDAQHFAQAIDLCVRGIEDQERQARSGTDRGAAERRLAFRLDRFAWLLAHCPDERVRDTKAAVRQARRATDLQPDVGNYWYTLAAAQYRNGDWRDSLASLEKMKAKEGELDASGWFLAAMDRHQLGQKGEARAALRKGVEWVMEQQRKAEGNALLRLQYEMMRPGIEALRREAEGLIEGKDPAGDRVG
jgi:tetratricopeptide (TPR) repeat protein